MRARRWAGFILSILVGLALGLAYGWLANPQPPKDTSLNGLRADYRTDAVLMVAEAYHADSSLELAQTRLAELSGDPALLVVQQAIIKGGELGYPRADLEKLAALAQALEKASAVSGETAP